MVVSLANSSFGMFANHSLPLPGFSDQNPSAALTSSRISLLSFARVLHDLLIASSSLPEVVTLLEVQDIIIRSVSTCYCVSSLPSTLPTLLLWGLKKSSSASSSQELHVALQCFKAFTSSASEEKASSLLWLGLWGSHGSPILPMPHTHRSITSSYEEHMKDCTMKKCSFLHGNDTNNSVENEMTDTQND